MNKTPWLAAAAALTLTAGLARAFYDSAPKSSPKAASAPMADAASAPMHAGHVMIKPGDIKWGPAPPSLPPGAMAAVLDGDPAAPGIFTLRLKMPPGYKIPAHSHPADEHVTVISGSLYMGLGDKLDPAITTMLLPHSFAVMKQGTHHFAMSKGECIVQLHGMGPWGINYVNPADDPRNKK